MNDIFFSWSEKKSIRNKSIQSAVFSRQEIKNDLWGHSKICILANVSSHDQKCHSINIFKTILQLSLECQKIDLSLFFNFNLWRLNPVRVPYILNNTIPENSRVIGIQRLIHKFIKNDSLWIIVTYRKVQPSTSARPGRMTNKNRLTDNCHNFFWSLFIWRNLFIFIIYPFMWSFSSRVFLVKSCLMIQN